MKAAILSISFILIGMTLLGQANPIYQVTFDDCTGLDAVGNLDDFMVSPTVNCDCGVIQDAVYFDEEADSIFLDNGVKDLIKENFTISMNFWVEDSPQPYALMSIQRFCTLDSALIIKYFPNSQTLDVQITKNFGTGIFMVADLDPNRCWHEMVFTREDNAYSLTVDGTFIETKNVNEDIVMGEKHQVRLGSSPCLNDTETFASARLDQLQIFDRTLSLEEIAALDQKPDQIISNDTTIFAGSSVLIETGSICATNFTWSPNLDLDDPDILEPTATPTSTTNYVLNIDYGSCTAQDEININVVDPDGIDCQNLLLPNVFTPNDDNINDEFKISNDFIISELDYFDIFDRWGSKVFSTQNKQEGWDGFFEGVRQAPAMYIYQVEYVCKGEEYKKLGNFSLLK